MQINTYVGPLMGRAARGFSNGPERTFSMVKKVRKAPGTARKKVAAKSRVTTTRPVQQASAGQVQDEKLRATIKRLTGEYNQDYDAGWNQGQDDGEEWAHSASLRDLRRICEANEQEIDADELLEMLTRYWNPQDLNNLGTDYDLPGFMSGYAPGFQRGALEVWKDFVAQRPSIGKTTTI